MYVVQIQKAQKYFYISGENNIIQYYEYNTKYKLGRILRPY
jgi:hypothetical protein